VFRVQGIELHHVVLGPGEEIDFAIVGVRADDATSSLVVTAPHSPAGWHGNPEGAAALGECHITDAEFFATSRTGVDQTRS
jgi:hypothetical protein